MKKNINLFCIGILLFTFFSCNNPQTEATSQTDSTKVGTTDFTGKSGSFIDARDNHSYKWVRIGNHVWMAENLSYKASSGCWAYGNDQNNVKTYGYLYDWETAKKVCPDGWHLPSDDEWSTLTNNLGIDVAGGKLKESGTSHWENPNTGANNETGFTALPGGRRDNPDESFTGIGSVGVWWSSTECAGDERETENHAWHYLMMNLLGNVYRDGSVQSTGYSVRCIKD